MAYYYISFFFFYNFSKNSTDIDVDRIKFRLKHLIL